MKLARIAIPAHPAVRRRARPSPSPTAPTGMAPGRRIPGTSRTAHVLDWDGAPYLPVGGAFTPHFWAEGQTDAAWDADTQALQTLKQHGVTDLSLTAGPGGLTHVPTAAVQRLLDYLDANGFQYGLEIADFPQDPLVGYVVKPVGLPGPRAAGPGGRPLQPHRRPAGRRLRAGLRPRTAGQRRGADHRRRHRRGEHQGGRPRRCPAAVPPPPLRRRDAGEPPARSVAGVRRVPGPPDHLLQPRPTRQGVPVLPGPPHGPDRPERRGPEPRPDQRRLPTGLPGLAGPQVRQQPGPAEPQMGRGGP